MTRQYCRYPVTGNRDRPESVCPAFGPGAEVTCCPVRLPGGVNAGQGREPRGERLPNRDLPGLPCTNPSTVIFRLVPVRAAHSRTSPTTSVTRSRWTRSSSTS